jgi:hypothetical protein
MKPTRILAIVPLVIIGFTIFIAIGGTLVMLLWNWLLPTMFGWPAISFWQALGLLALCRILFGGSRISGSQRSKVRRRMAERWDNPTPESA